MLAEQYKNCKVKTTSIKKIVDLVNDIILNRCNPIVIINLNQCLFQVDDNLDDNCYKIYDSQFRKLCSIVFKNCPNNLIFITSDYPQFEVSNNTFLNSLDIVEDSTFHRYNVIHTSGEKYSEAVRRKLQLYSLTNYGNPYILYIDTNDDRIDEFENVIEDERVNYIFIKISKPEYNFITNFLFPSNDFEICDRYTILKEKMKQEKMKQEMTLSDKIDFFTRRSKVIPGNNSININNSNNSTNSNLYCDEV